MQKSKKERVDKSRMYRMNKQEESAILQASAASSKLISKGRFTAEQSIANFNRQCERFKNN